MIPKVTIITPTFNHERFIGACIDSVIRQRYVDWEMIIIDDGSTDRTGEIVQSYGDERIRYVRQENLGVERLVESYNRALALAEGDLIAILEGDDYWPSDRLEVQVLDFDDPELVLSAGLFEVVTENGETVMVGPGSLPPAAALANEPVGSASASMLHHNTLTFTWPATVMMRRTAIEDIGGFQSFPVLPLVDLPTFTRMGLEGRWKFHQTVLGYWRRHGGSVTNARFPRILNGAYAFAASFLKEHRARMKISDAELDVLEFEWMRFQGHRVMILGCMAAFSGDRAKATRCFNRAKEFGVSRRVRLGFALAKVFPWPERVFWVLAVYRGVGQLTSGDALVSEEMDADEFPILRFRGN